MCGHQVKELVNAKGLFSFYEDGHQECCRARKVLYRHTMPCTRALYRHIGVWPICDNYMTIDTSACVRGAGAPAPQAAEDSEGLDYRPEEGSVPWHPR